jgi:hypothetical protein
LPGLATSSSTYQSGQNLPRSYSWAFGKLTQRDIADLSPGAHKRAWRVIEMGNDQMNSSRSEAPPLCKKEIHFLDKRAEWSSNRS